LWFALSLLPAFISGLHALTYLLSSISPREGFMMAGDIITSFSRYIFVGLGFLTLLSSLYPAACFVMVVEETASGEDEVRWESTAWYEYAGYLVYLIWLFGCSAAIPTATLAIISLSMPIDPLIWWGVIGVFVMGIFPFCMLSALAGGAPWMLIDFPLLLRWFGRPHVVLALYLQSLMFALPSLILGYWVVIWHWIWLAPVVGIVYSLCWLTYARLIGRVGWALSQDNKDRRKKKRKRQD
jgi:hypothetical protein